MSKQAVFRASPHIKHSSSDSEFSFTSVSHPDLHPDEFHEEVLDWNLVFPGGPNVSRTYVNDLGDPSMDHDMFWDTPTPEEPPTGSNIVWGQDIIMNPSGEYEKMSRTSIPWTPDRHYSDPIGLTKSGHESERRKVQNRSA